MNYMTALVQLPLVKETSKERIRTPEDVGKACSDIINLAQETVQVLCLNTKRYLINRQMVTLGLADSSLVHPREVMRLAIQENASAIVAVHNHPSGDPTPSAGDVRITKQLIAAGQVIDIRLLDHVILAPGEGGGGFRAFSMREDGICQFI